MPELVTGLITGGAVGILIGVLFMYFVSTRQLVNDIRNMYYDGWRITPSREKPTKRREPDFQFPHEGLQTPLESN
jgi:hypothetical protein